MILKNRNIVEDEVEHPPLPEEEEEEEKDFWTLWNEFQVALKDIHTPFNEWYWIYTVTRASVRHVFILLTKHTISFSILHILFWISRYARSILPCVATSMILFVTWSYYAYLRQILLFIPSASSFSISKGFLISSIHDLIVVYLVVQILFHYTYTVFTSPGIVTGSVVDHAAAGGGDDDGMMIPCHSTQGQGGCCFTSPKFSRKEEEGKTKSYFDSIMPTQTLERVDHHSSSSVIYYPSTQSTFCKKCNFIRPSRAHHCSTCNRCILQVCTKKKYIYVYLDLFCHGVFVFLSSSESIFLYFLLSLQPLYMFMYIDGSSLSLGE